MKLRLIHQNDFTGLYNLIQRNKSKLASSFPIMINRCQSSQQTEQFVVEKVQQQLYRTGFYFVMEDEQKVLRGLISIRNIDWDLGRGEVAYFVDLNLQSKGNGTNALISIIQYAKQELKLNKLIAKVLPENLASISILTKNHFVQEGLLRNEFKIASGELFDVAYFGLLLN